MKRTLAMLAASVAATAALIAGPVDPAPAHTSTETYNVCRLIEAHTFGVEPNNIGLYYRHIHIYGFHLAQCCYVSAFDPSIRAMAQYTYGFGTLIWPQNDPWCRST